MADKSCVLYNFYKKKASTHWQSGILTDKWNISYWLSVIPIFNQTHFVMFWVGLSDNFIPNRLNINIIIFSIFLIIGTSINCIVLFSFKNVKNKSINDDVNVFMQLQLYQFFTLKFTYFTFKKVFYQFWEVL